MMSLGTFFNSGAKRASHLQRRSGLQSFGLRKRPGLCGPDQTTLGIDKDGPPAGQEVRGEIN